MNDPQILEACIYQRLLLKKEMITQVGYGRNHIQQGSCVKTQKGGKVPSVIQFESHLNLSIDLFVCLWCELVISLFSSGYPVVSTSFMEEPFFSLLILLIDFWLCPVESQFPNQGLNPFAAMEVWNSNHWTARESLVIVLEFRYSQRQLLCGRINQ